MPGFRKKHQLEGGEGSSSREGSPILRRRQVPGKAALEDSSSIETDEDFEKLSNEEFADGKPSKTVETASSKPFQNPRGSNFDDLSDKDIYEMQLKNLQQQLENAVIEKSLLDQQLKRYEEIKDLTRFKTEMEKIRDENAALKLHCREVENRLTQARVAQSDRRNADRERTAGTEPMADQPPARFSAARDRFEEWKLSTVERLLDLLSDFSDEPEVEQVEEGDDGEELSVKRLKANIKRFKASYVPIMSFIKAVTILLSWQSPSATFLAFCIYMYCAWRGWLISLMLGLMIWLLSSTYFISRGWNISYSLLPYHLMEEPEDDSQSSSSMTDKYRLVFHITRKVQNYLGFIADQLEKLYNMIYWGNPEATGKLMRGVVSGFIASLLFSESWMFFFAALAVGFKLFILNALYNKFPRFKAKYDSVHLFFKSLPTHSDIEEKKEVEEKSEAKYDSVHLFIKFLPTHSDHEEERQMEEKSEFVTFPPIVDTDETFQTGYDDDRTLAFNETFSLPASEYPLPGWEGGKRCTLINKERYLSAAFRHGRLYLTKSNLCFGTSRIHHTKRNMVIALKDICSVGKAKPFQFIPGRGMSIQVTLFGSEKPHLFSGILGRDDILQEIQHAVEDAGIRGEASETDGGGATTRNGSETNTDTGRDESDIYT